MALPGERKYHASANQKRMYVLDQLAPGGTEYNVPVAIRMRGALDVPRLQKALEALAERHASLRAAFRIEGDEVVQEIANRVHAPLRIHVARTSEDIEAIRKRFVRPFDLGRAPLFRTCLVRLGKADHVLLLDLHHIVCDWVSVDILQEELGRLYDGQALEELPGEYEDFVLWQRSFAGTPEAAAQADYWLGLLGDGRPVASLPADHRRKPVQSFDGDRILMRPGTDLAAALRALARKNRVSMYMLLLAAYYVFLAKYTGQEDVLVGTLVAGRHGERFRGIVGLFVNTLVLRSRPRGELRFADYLKQVRDECLSAFENQEYQFEDLVDRIAPPRDLGRNPLFDTMFSALSYDQGVRSYGGVDFSRHELGYDISKFDLSLTVIEQDRELVLELEFSTALFRKETIERMAAHYLNVLRSVAANPEVKLSDVELLAPGETVSLAAAAGERRPEAGRARSVVELFEGQVRKTPLATAVSFGEEHVSYRELGLRARALAAKLAELGVRRGDLVGVAAAPSIEMVAAVLGVLEAGAAYLPIDPATPMERFRTIVADSGMAALLAGADSQHFETSGPTTIRLGGEVLRSGEDGPEPAPVGPGDPAYVIYTSGSTGTPKGVKVSHGALSNYIDWAARTYTGGEALSFALHSPLSVDLTVTSVFTPLVSGGRIAIYRRDDVASLMREIVGRNEVHLVKLTPTHLGVLAEVLGDAVPGASSLRRIIVGGEDLRTDLAAKVHAGFSGRVQIVNEYGPTEATVGCTAHVYDPESDTGPSVPIGKAIDNTNVFVLDRYRKPVPAGVTGELYVAGACLADGYLNNPRMTDERFAVNQVGPARMRMYRTGDLARLLPGRGLEFLGREDDQVKIRGFRIELGEIEANLRRLPAVREAVVTRRVDAAGDACLCAYVVGDGEISAESLRRGLAEHLPAHMIPAWFVPLDRLPVARGGKLDRSALPDPHPVEAGGRPREAPRSRTEAAMVRIWEQVLGVPRIGIDDNFFALGGQSLKATLMIVRLNREMRSNLSLRDVFTHPSVRELAPLVAVTGEGASMPIKPVMEQEHYPVSSAQKRIFILHQMAPADIQYNVPWAIGIDGTFDAARWEQAFRALIARHESLRTSFTLAGDEIVQQVHPRVDFAFEQQVAARTMEQAIEGFVRPFDLGRAPLIRAAVVETEAAPGRALLVDMHHIVSDGMSAQILLEDLCALYQGRALQAPEIQYKDYAAWQRAYAGAPVVQAQGAYWAKVFEGELPVLSLPTDFPRGAVQSFDGDLVRFRIGSSTVERLKAIHRDCGATMHMALLAAYTVLLWKYTGQEDIVVGMPIAGRSHASLERVVGMFVNTLAMRNRLSGELTFRELLGTVRSNALDAYSNQDYQFEELVDRLAIDRDLSRNPLFDTMFASLDGGSSTFEVEGARVELIDFDWKVSKFDLTLLAAERKDGLALELEYCTRLFRRSTIERLSAHFERLLEQIGRDPDRRLAELDPLTAAEREHLLLALNRTGHAYPDGRGAHQCFEEQVDLRPDHAAVVFGDTSLSYRELNRRANQVARALVSRGVTREELVAIMAAPSLEMIVGILAILKAGCAYLPIDHDCPEERGRAILDDSKARIVLVAGGAAWRDSSRDVLDLGAPGLYEGDGSNLLRASSGRDLAYVIYTSGTTGLPKGVMIEHHSVNNLCAWHNQQFEVTEADRAAKYARFGFDASVWEIFPYLQAGAALYVIDERIRLDLPALNRYFEDHGITIAFLPTQVCELFLEHENRSLRILLTGGDRLRRLQPRPYRVVNNYGPTESTVVATSATVEAGQERIPIGAPIFNTRVYLLGSGNQLVPIGVPGEVCIAGVGLARAYLNAPAQTEARFVANPFEPGGRLYRTGDLARWLPDGQLEYIGRTDKQVKIRGCRTEPREIEATILACEAVRDAVVIAREDSQHNKLLCAYVVWHQQPGEAELRTYLAKHLPDYMVPSFIVTVEEIPMNATGKVDLARLPSPEGGLSAGRSHVAASTDAERRLAEIWCRVLELERVSVQDNFFEIGGDSLRATVMLAKANKEFAATVGLGAVFDNPTIAALARCFEQAPQQETLALKPVESRPYYTTTPMQALLYSLCSSVKEVEYNLPMAYVLDGELDVPRLEDAFRRLVQRHESLRTSFHRIDGRIVQVVSPSVDFAINILEPCAEDDIPEMARDFIRPFDLGRAPLVRVSLVPVGPRRHVLLLDVHHLVSDGTSMGILFREMAALYAGQELPRPAATFKDFAEWLATYVQRKEVRAQEEYWRGVFTDMPPLLKLDTDHTRQGRFTFIGGMIPFEASPEIHRALKAMCVRHGVTLYMLLLAAYDVLLSKYGRQEDMIIAAPTSGRYIADVHEVVGMFVNTHVVRSQPRAGLRFEEFLQQVKIGVRDALDHQSFQLWEFYIGYALQTGGRSPFSSVFVVQDEGFKAINMPGLTVRERDASYHTAKFDLTLGAVERDGGLHFELEYSSDVYERSTAKRIARHYMNILEQIVADPTRELRHLELMKPDEKEAVLRLSAGPRSDPSAGETVLSLFERQAEEFPDRVAAIAGGARTSHGELNRRANRLARHLRAEGVGAGDVVGLLLHPSIEMIVAVLATWKAGAAYAPLSPGWPQKRVESAVARCGARLVLRDRDLQDESWYDADGSNLGLAADAGALAYVSAVAERSVQVEHRSLLVRCRWYLDRFRVTPADRSAKYGDLAATATIFELFPLLCAGGSIWIVPESAGRLNELLDENGVTMAWLPGQWCARLASAARTSLRALLTFGRNVRSSSTGAYELVRCAGPAESTEISTCCTVHGDGRSAVLGKPLPDTEVYIVGHDGGLQPVGVTGELCVAGACLARGGTGELVANPHVPGGRMFRTGDSARWLPGGSVERTRRAAEVSVEGHRVSLAEIEQRLASHPAVGDAAVVFDEDDPLRPRLVAFLVPRAPLQVPPCAFVGTLKSHLAEWLPCWMIPADYMQVAAIPRDADGKVQYESLPLPERPAAAVGHAGGLSPPIAEKVASLAGEVLGIPHVGLETNLTHLGMSSVAAMDLTARIQKAFGVAPEVGQVLAAPTVSEISQRLDQALRARDGLLPAAMP